MLQQVGRAGEMFVAAEIHRRGGYAVTFIGRDPGGEIIGQGQGDEEPDVEQDPGDEIMQAKIDRQSGQDGDHEGGQHHPSPGISSMPNPRAVSSVPMSPTKAMARRSLRGPPYAESAGMGSAAV